MVNLPILGMSIPIVNPFGVVILEGLRPSDCRGALWICQESRAASTLRGAKNTKAAPFGAAFEWYRLPGLNRGPLDPQSSALTN